MLSVPFLLGLLAAQAASPQIQVDPLLVVQADEVWGLIGRKDNPVWPGWDARRTPLLIYFPGKQDLLINHPNPPEGFVRYAGPLRSKAGEIYLRDGKTTFDRDGQNTSTRVNGVETLVVADTLSTRRQWAEGLASSIVAEPARADEIVGNNLTPNPYAQMLMFAHEAFHVYQRRRAPAKAPIESALFEYPSLSVENNVGDALEADALAAALRAKDDAGLRRHALEWLVARLDRRRSLPASSAAYEDACEFNEGLAKYVEYRALQMLDGHRPAREMWLIQGFHGYGDLTRERDRMVRQMQGYMNGTNVVNDDLYGASPVRFRLYFSGMAIGALLDRLGAKWHDAIFAPSASLTSLAQQALHSTPQELTEARTRIRTGNRYEELTREKSKLANDGAQHIASVLRGFDTAPGELVIDFSALKNPNPQFSFTAFGILRIDDDRNVFRLIPIRGKVGTLSFAEDAARPVLYDRKAETIHLQLTGSPTEMATGDYDGKDLKLPGIDLKSVKGHVIRDGRRVTLRLID